MPQDWFVVPQTGTGTRDDPFRPKYRDDERSTFLGWHDIDIPPALGLPLSGVQYIALIEADQSDLDLLRSQPDAYLIAYDGDFAPREVANFLNEHISIVSPIDHGIHEHLPMTPRQWASWIVGNGAELQ